MSRIRSITSAVPRPRLAAAAASTAAIVALGAGIAGAGTNDSALLGKTKNAPSPNCPEKKVPPGEPTTDKDVCQVTGQVTGYQRSADGEKGLFKVREDGKIVAWSVDLADPRKSERETFGEASQTNQYGKSPTAGISIIRAADGRDFKLKSSSPILPVRGFYGQKPVITLDEPLRVRKGDVVALTTATWLPAFSIKDQTRQDTWIASRKEEDCEVPPEIPEEERTEYFFDHTAPHRNQGSERPYECLYDSARLLYWAYFVPNN